MNPARAAACLLAITLLAACSGGSDTPLALYSDRLQRSLDQDILPAPRTLPPLPRVRDLSIDVGTGSIDLLDMLTLRDCELSVTIGKTNSSLGKLATDSQRLLLELEFLHRAPACILHLQREGASELAATLEEASVLKRRLLPARIWNATLGGEEFRAFWKRPLRLHAYPENTGGDVPAALEALRELIEHWQQGEFDTGHEQLETLLARIRLGDGGSLLAALETQERTLSAATSVVQVRTTNSPICFGKTPSPRGRIVDNVVRKFFVGEVQPWSVALSRRQRTLTERIHALETALAEVMPQPYRNWREARDALLASSVAAPRTHALALAELLETCGLRPGQKDIGGSPV